MRPRLRRPARAARLTPTLDTSPTPRTPARRPPQNVSARAAGQARLGAEAALLGRVYSTHLYGGATLPDSVADGSRDAGDGALFASPAYADLLFRTEACLRADQRGCVGDDHPLYAVTHSGVDPMVQRLIEEADLLALDSPDGITPDAASNPRW